jgi:hypothetical protein
MASLSQRIKDSLARRKAEKPERVKKRAEANARRLEHKRHTGASGKGGTPGGGGG